jgi:hypothetical protein
VQNSQITPNAQRSFRTRAPKFLVRQMAKSPNGSDEPQMAEKSLQTTRKRKAKAQGALVRENSLRSDFRVPTVQMLISVPQKMMVESSQCWPKWKDKKKSLV